MKNVFLKPTVNSNGFLLKGVGIVKLKLTLKLKKTEAIVKTNKIGIKMNDF